MAVPPPGLDDYRSAILGGVIDRSPPVRFGAIQPFTQTYNPGDAISVGFNEAINCNNPFTFNVYFDLTDTATNKSIILIDPILYECEGHEVKIDFSPVASVWRFFCVLESVLLSRLL